MLDKSVDRLIDPDFRGWRQLDFRLQQFALRHCLATCEKRAVEQHVDACRDGANDPRLALRGTRAVHGLIDIQAHIGNAGADRCQRNRPVDRSQRAGQLRERLEIPDPHLFAQVAVGVQRQVCVGKHARADRVAQMAERVARHRFAVLIDHAGMRRAPCGVEHIQAVKQPDVVVSLAVGRQREMPHETRASLGAVVLRQQPPMQFLRCREGMKRLHFAGCVEDLSAAGGHDAQDIAGLVADHVEGPDARFGAGRSAGLQGLQARRIGQVDVRSAQDAAQIFLSEPARLAVFEGAGNEIGLGHGAEIVGEVAPERVQLFVIAGFEIHGPELAHDLRGQQPDFVALIERVGMGVCGVEAAEHLQGIGVVLVVGVETVHDQLREGHGLIRRVAVLPAIE